MGFRGGGGHHPPPTSGLPPPSCQGWHSACSLCVSHNLPHRAPFNPETSRFMQAMQPPIYQMGGGSPFGGGLLHKQQNQTPWGFLILSLSQTTDTWAGFHHSLLMAPFLASIWACCRASHFPEEEHTTQSQKFTENTPDYGRLFQGPFPK